MARVVQNPAYTLGQHLKRVGFAEEFDSALERTVLGEHVLRVARDEQGLQLRVELGHLVATWRPFIVGITRSVSNRWMGALRCLAMCSASGPLPATTHRSRPHQEPRRHLANPLVVFDEQHGFARDARAAHELGWWGEQLFWCSGPSAGRL